MHASQQEPQDLFPITSRWTNGRVRSLLKARCITYTSSDADKYQKGPESTTQAERRRKLRPERLLRWLPLFVISAGITSPPPSPPPGCASRDRSSALADGLMDIFSSLAGCICPSCEDVPDRPLWTSYISCEDRTVPLVMLSTLTYLRDTDIWMPFTGPRLGVRRNPQLPVLYSCTSCQKGHRLTELVPVPQVSLL